MTNITPKLILKLFGLFFFFSVLILSITGFLLMMSNLPQTYAKNYLNNYLKNDMGINASFQFIKGNLYDSITVENINVYGSTAENYNILYIDSASLQYNIFKLIFLQNKLNAINHITLDGADYHIIRAPNGKFQNISIQQTQRARTIDFTGSIYLRNINLHYKDFKGWKKTPLAVPFYKKIKQINGEILFKDSTKGVLTATGIYNNSTTPCLLSGHLWPNEKDFILHFESSDLPLDQWGPYVMRQDGYDHFSGTTDINGYITKKKFSTNSKSALWYDIDFNIKDASLTTPFVNSLITSSNGTITIKEGILDPHYINSLRHYIKPNDVSKIHNLLKQQSIIDPKSIINKESLTQLENNTFSNNQAHYKTIKEAILNPKFLLQFTNLTGKVHNNKVILNGTMNQADKWLELAFASPQFNSFDLQYLYPQLAALNLKKNVNASMQIYGNMAKPILKGTVKSPHLSCFNYNLYDNKATFKLYDNNFSFNLTQSTLLDSPLVVTVDVPNINTSPLISIEAFLSQLDLQSKFNFATTSGNCDIATVIAGPPSLLKGNVTINGNDLSIYNQSIDSFSSELTILEKGFSLTKGNVFLNNSSSPVDISLLFADTSIDVTVSGNNLLFQDPFNFTQNPSPTGKLAINSMLSIVAQPNPADFWALYGNLSATIENPTFYSQTFQNFEIDLDVNNDQFIFNKFNFLTANGYAKLGGKSTLTTINSLNLDAKNFPFSIIVNNSNLLKKYVSSNQGFITTSAQFTQKESSISGSGFVDINDFSVQDIQIDQLNSIFEIDNTLIQLKDLSLFTQNSSVLTHGNYDYSNNILDLSIKPSTFINVNDIPFIKNNNIQANGQFSLSGNFNYKQPNFVFAGNCNSKALTFLSSNFKNIHLDATLASDQLSIHDFQTTLDKGSLALQGTINYNSSNFSYTLFPKFKNFPLMQFDKFRNLASIFKETQQFQSDANIPSTFIIKSPFRDNSFINIFSQSHFSSELKFINALQQNVAPKTKETDFLKTISNGLLTGDISIKGLSQQLPSLEGQAKIKSFESNLLDIEKLTLDFSRQDNLTFFTLNTAEAMVNSNPIESSTIKGSFSTDFVFSIENNAVEFADKTINNVVTGTTSLKKSKTTTDYPIDVFFNFAQDNMAIFSLFSSQLDDIDYGGDLLINISGSIKNPFINVIVNSENEILLDLKKDNDPLVKTFKINSAPLVIKNNKAVFSNLNIEEINSDDEFPFQTSIAGSLALQEINFDASPHIISSINLAIKDNNFEINSNILNGNLYLANTQFNGTVITPLGYFPNENFYQQLDLSPALFSSDITIKNSELFLPPLGTSASDKSPFPFNLDVNVNIDENVFFGGPIFGNSFLGASADLEFSSTIEPLHFQGNLESLEITNEISIANGTLSILNQPFKLISPTEQQLYSKNDLILPNTISMKNTIDDQGNPLVSPILTLRALCVIENDISATENTSLAYTHVILSINDVLNNLQNIDFDIYESDNELPKNISELTHIQNFKISNQVFQVEDSFDQTAISELLKILIPELYIDPSSDQILTTIGESGLNNLIRRSIMRPLEKNISKQIGINDLKIDYNIGKKILQDTDDTLGIQVIKNIFSDRLILRLSTELELVGSEDSSADNIELSEAELSYYLLKNKNLSINYSNYKSPYHTDTYLSKISMRYDYEY